MRVRNKYNSKALEEFLATNFETKHHVATLVEQHTVKLFQKLIKQKSEQQREYIPNGYAYAIIIKENMIGYGKNTFN